MFDGLDSGHAQDEEGLKNSMSKLGALASELERLTAHDLRLEIETRHLIAQAREEFVSLLRQRRELVSLYEVAREMAANSDLDELLHLVVNRAVVLVGAERGYLVLGDASAFRVAASQRFSTEEAESTDGSFSSTLLRRVMALREPILTTNVQTDDRFELSQSILLQDIRSVIAVPMVTADRLEGAIYVDTRLSVRPFTSSDLELLQAMASHAALSIRNARLYADSVERNTQLRATLQELEATQEQLVQSEKLAAIGRLAAGVAHELRSPLSVMRSELSHLEARLDEEPALDPGMIKGYLGQADTEIDRQAKIIDDLLFFSRYRPSTLAPVDLNQLLADTLARVSIPSSIARQCRFQGDLEIILADEEQIRQVFINLVTNAIQAMRDGGQLTIETCAVGDFAEVRVSDTGVGMTPQVIACVFEPFFTTKSKGIGLGLSVSRTIIEAHHGRISVQSAAGIGTTFVVQLPYQLIG